MRSRPKEENKTTTIAAAYWWCHELHAVMYKSVNLTTYQRVALIHGLCPLFGHVMISHLIRASRCVQLISLAKLNATRAKSKQNTKIAKHIFEIESLWRFTWRRSIRPNEIKYERMKLDAFHIVIAVVAYYYIGIMLRLPLAPYESEDAYRRLFWYCMRLGINKSSMMMTTAATVL